VIVEVKRIDNQGRLVLPKRWRVANILEAKVNLETALKFIENLMLAENIEILPVTYEDYLRALLIAKEKNVSLNDALAYLKMEEAGVEEIYTFDNHFRNLDVKIVQE
jgi:predicted nucleic acid-binding protein